MNITLLLALVALATANPSIMVPDTGVDARDYLSTTVSFSSRSLSEGDTLVVFASARNISDSDVLLRPELVIGRRGPASTDGTVEEQATAAALASMPLASAAATPGTLQTTNERGVRWYVLPPGAELRLECRVPWDAVVDDQQAEELVLEAQLELEGRDRRGQQLGQHLLLGHTTLRVD